MSEANVNYTIQVDAGFTITGGVTLSRVPCVGEEIQIPQERGDPRECVVRRVVHLGGGHRNWAHAWLLLELTEIK